MTKQNFELIIKNDINELNKLAEFLESIGASLDLSDSVIFDINISLDELITNIISYGLENNTSQNISLTFELIENQIRLIIKDNGIAFNPFENESPNLTENVDDRKIGGLGIFIVKKKMDSVDYQRIDNQNIITLYKNV